MWQYYKKKRHPGEGVSNVQQQGSSSPLPVREIKTASRNDKAQTYKNQPQYFGFGLENGAEFCSWAYLCERHKCSHQHKTHETRNRKAGQGWAGPSTVDRLSAACQENSSSCILFSPAVFPGGILTPRQKASPVGQGTRSLFTTLWLASSSQTLLCKKVILHQLWSS